MFFTCYNVQYHRHQVEDWIIAKGDITNESNKNYSTAVFKAKIFSGEMSIGSAVIKIHGFRSKMTRPFEAVFEGSTHLLIPKISKLELYLESVY